MSVFRLPRARRIRTLRLPYIDRRLQMRLQYRHLGLERGFDLGKLDLSLRLDLEMDRVVLSLLLLELGLMCGERGVDLGSRLHGQ
ncbi:hypothetical protein G8O24_03185 [Bradyrhizobium sp. INPA01-394B]|uniref:Uncharacterized protein n=1 Tax=Bradyrhizobium campsiandrae TaxID=1729892 RepID=A0ABR7U9Y6_9BRAD|nr:hypothetical protein [Bradyrhizobium campsiandrae]MBC9876349.1 hypothetical protein [Bradyrhizobium campsiandrae]MBC9980128.1 hypothetical protein [Bradyrhizobium campsiandrae]